MAANRSVSRQELAARYRVDPVAADHPGDELRSIENSVKGAGADVEAAGESAEGGHDEAGPVGGKAPPAQTPAAGDHGSNRMQMARNLSGGWSGRRDMAQDQGPQIKAVHDLTTKILRRFGVVIAGDPDPAGKHGEVGNVPGVVRCDARTGTTVMKAVAERDHSVGAVVLDEAP